jgi:hypothetical protein
MDLIRLPLYTDQWQTRVDLAINISGFVRARGLFDHVSYYERLKDCAS